MRLIAPLLMAAAVAGVLPDQARRVTPPQEVATLDELRPKTTDQLVRSTAWSGGGRRRLTGTESLNIRIYPHPEMRPLPPPTEADPFGLSHRVCVTSAVVAGTPTKAQAFLNVDETELFTDFQVAVDQRIRPAAGEASVLVSIGGGRVLVAGKALIEVQYEEFLEVGQHYMLLLRWAPQFKTHFLDWIPLPIAGGQVILPNGQLKPEASFLASLKGFAEQCKTR